MFPCGTIATLLERRNGEGVSDRYRRALDRKIDHIIQREIPSLKRENAEHAVSQTKELLGKVEKLLQRSKSAWIFGTTHPTALDAHLIVFIARITDAGRGELVPARAKSYSDEAKSTAEWKEMMQERETVPPGGF